MSDSSIDKDRKSFDRILKRNVALPLAFGFLSAAFFSAIVYYLLEVNRMVEVSVTEVVQAHDVIRLIVDQETGMRGFLLTGDETFLEPYELALPKLGKRFDELKWAVEQKPEQLRRIEWVENLHNRWSLFAQDMIERRRQNLPVVEHARDGRGKLLMDEIRNELNAFIASERQSREERTNRSTRITTILIGGFLLLSLVFSRGLVYLGRRDLYSLSTGYSRSLEQQREYARDLERRAWYRTGRSQLGEAIIGELSLPVLGQSILGFLAQYLEVAVGSLYVLEGSRLQRVAEFAYDLEQLNHNRFLDMGEGMVGQAALEQRMLRLSDLPDGYLKVSSALGNTPSRSIMVVPVLDNGMLNAVLELGFLRSLRHEDEELLNSIVSQIGSAIEAARYRQRLQKALTETQLLNEELQVQQEELRAANEELEVQSSALHESQSNLEEQQAELEQTNQYLSEQASELASQRDEIGLQNQRLQQAQLVLEQHAEALQRASRYKSEFLANMSHELRTPLNSTLILAKLLADNPQGNLSDEQIRFARSIYASGNDLLLLINDILDLAKVEAGKLDIRPETVVLSALVDGLRELFLPLAMNKSLQFTVELEPDVPDTLFVDHQRLEQIVKNLLSNALKFTESGFVTLRVYRHSADMLAFAIRDSGIGIPAEQQAMIFEAFRQADGTTNRRYGGTGLGLSISRELAQLLGSRIEMQSEPGQGSVFTLLVPLHYELSEKAQESSAMLPAPIQDQPVAPVVPAIAAPVSAPIVRARAEDALPDDREAYPFRDRCVLIIEDESQFAMILKDLAHELGYSCLIEHNADNGFEAALRYRPDAVLLDMRLPDHSGLTVLERLKGTPQTRHIPVHVVSAEDHREAALHMGAIGYALKPTSREELKAVFQRLESKLAQKVKRILLVEDDALQRESVSRLIEDVDVEITAVELGEQALERLRSTVFDCMIIDLKLPDMDGHELLERMAHETICSFPPVIVYTGRNLTRDEESALMKYSRSIIIKGARSPERLLDEVTLFLHKVELDMPPERQKMLKSARNRDKTFEDRKILVVDDDVRNVFALTSALEHKGAVVEIARNGYEAIERLRSDRQIDLVLMDIMMPEMDGFTAMQEIRKDPSMARLPIIAVTAKAMKDDQERCLRAGANDYLAKPIDLDRLFSLIRVWLPKVKLF
ncbi:response regulator [Azomonas macrocytogenes]|uniref:histidine kinase n=1 Tax=Azomonas macrocytogenes TaxID=69962 RepID=A0A839T3M2_AZOMA|nr:response regulator [Azomonas macrocytogenes]MBB3102944.1 CheY-like chemotaxis protein/CHASE3 domain sensor protein/putative methionine-R-sulfoxide reductase with GAF domain [Azomonas macrocytogenes]